MQNFYICILVELDLSNLCYDYASYRQNVNTLRRSVKNTIEADIERMTSVLF